MPNLEWKQPRTLAILRDSLPSKLLSGALIIRAGNSPELPDSSKPKPPTA